MIEPDGPADACYVAGADLAELKDFSTARAHKTKYLKGLSTVIPRIKKPVIAAIEGFAV